jgi:hypothetical protein
MGATRYVPMSTGCTNVRAWRRRRRRRRMRMMMIDDEG